MPTARYFIQDALEILRVYSPGEDANGADLARGQAVLNAMIDSWSNESLTCFAWKTSSFLMQPGVPSYTIGPGGVINDTRPLRVSDDAGSAYLLDVNNNRYPMDVLDQMSWNLRVTAVINSNLPDTLFYDPQFPLGIINIWPTPSLAYTCFFSSYLQLTEFTSLDASVTFPPGYNRAISTNLCLSLKPYFATAQIDPLIIEEARLTKGNVKRNNMRAQRSVYEPELIARGNSTFNIYSDRRA